MRVVSELKILTTTKYFKVEEACNNLNDFIRLVQRASPEAG